MFNSWYACRALLFSDDRAQLWITAIAVYDFVGVKNVRKR